MPCSAVRNHRGYTTDLPGTPGLILPAETSLLPFLVRLAACIERRESPVTGCTDRIRGVRGADAGGVLARADQRAKGALYLRGLLLDGKRKSTQPMAGRLGVDHHDSSSGSSPRRPRTTPRKSTSPPTPTDLAGRYCALLVKGCQPRRSARCLGV